MFVLELTVIKLYKMHKVLYKVCEQLQACHFLEK